MIEHPIPSADSNEEISALIKTLLAAEQRLVVLTAGEVDAITDSEGRTFLLRRAQEELRQKEFELLAKRHLQNLRQDALIEYR